MEPDFEKFDTRLRAAVGKEALYTWAARVGINKGTLNSALSRKSFPKADILMQMADDLDCSVDYLLGRSDERSICPPTAASLHAQYAALTVAIQSINIAHTNVEKLASLAALSPQEQQLVDAFRVAGPERKQIFLDLARAGKPPKAA